MGKHRKNQQYRRVLIAAVAVGAVGVPTAAVACVDWKDDSGRQTEATAWQTEQSPRHASHQVRKQTAAPATPSASPSTRTEHRPAPAPTRTAQQAPEAAKTTPATKPAKTTKPAKPVTAKPAALKSASAKPVSTPTVRQVSTAPRPVQTTTSPGTGTPQPAATASGDVARVVELVNAERAKVGCSPVELNSTLSKAAQDHSADMAAHNTMSHTGSDGSDPGSRITAAGYQWSAYGENVAYGYATPEQVMDGWMNSPGHRENILNCSYKEIGVGLAQPGDYWTQDFGTAR
ncbi:CAP domain-containing protein [Streptomyces sp. SID2999]|uniref:CAP domain-containing protein n=1 Tax=Streptomyces sp. SID2999 TaxID=2690258 RepID=UPI001368FF8D|nr:CAP domain-containing protein [Streptomyces sp. SID2999]MYZ07519.1 CAP domain-containing protein [Streptomyces sp. SID2999]